MEAMSGKIGGYHNSIREGIQVAVKVDSFLLAQIKNIAMRHRGVARMCKLRGHSMGKLSTCVNTGPGAYTHHENILNYTLSDRL